MLRLRRPPEWGIDPVPAPARILRGIDFFVFWTSLAVGLLVLQAGALLVGAFRLSLPEALAISFLGSAVGSIILATAGHVGARYGVPSMVSLRPSFGLLGSYLPSGINVLQLVGWTTFELIIMAEAAVALTGTPLGPYTKHLWVLLFAGIVYLMLVSGPLAVIKTWLEKFAIWTTYASTIWITIFLLGRAPTLPAAGAGLSERLLALDLVIAMPVSWMPLAADYNRFASRPRGAFLGTVAGYTLANTWFYSLGAGLAAAFPAEAVVYSIALVSLGAFALLALLVDETDNAFADIYSAAVSLQNVAPRQRQWRLGLAITLISIALALTIPITQYEGFLLLIGASFIPAFGVLLADYARRRHYTQEDFYSPRGVRWPALAAWAAGFAAYYLFAYTVGIGGTLPSLITASALYLLLARWSK